jgi:hypothetical protein
MDAASWQRGKEAPFANPQQKLWSAGFKRRSGGLSFGFFAQTKKSNSPVGATNRQDSRLAFTL